MLRPEPTIAKPVPKRGALKTEKSNAFWSSFRLVRLMMSKVNLLKQSFSPSVHMMQHTVVGGRGADHHKSSAEGKACLIPRRRTMDIKAASRVGSGRAHPGPLAPDYIMHGSVVLFRSLRSEFGRKSVRVQIRKILFRSGPICEVHCKYSGSEHFRSGNYRV